MNNEHWIVYRDVEDFPRKQFEVVRAPKPQEMVIKEQTIPGMFGYAPTYIRHYDLEMGEGVKVHLVTYTEHEPTAEEIAKIAQEAMSHVTG